jgi:hypothetical protein
MSTNISDFCVKVSPDTSFISRKDAAWCQLVVGGRLRAVAFAVFYFFFGPGLAFLGSGLLPLMSWNKIKQASEKRGG